ncbi:ribbon-helix-helix domain-containing protein [Deinococcus misasensis]|uniref:ribbon-helix-helix domain-containing protein n=1 Tax=Deinococcus misasensis TaxID=392413 RepID=UPI0005557E5B|nr:hypothetical protein [Deinococcus misasensis]
MQQKQNAIKFSVSLPRPMMDYLEQYQHTHELPSRSEVLFEALKALREKELAEGYRLEAEEHSKNLLLMLEGTLNDGLETSDGIDW